MGNWRAGTGCLMLLAVALYLVVLAPILEGRRDEDAPLDAPVQTASPVAPREVVVRYFVTGSSPSVQTRITYRDAAGGIVEVPNYQGPWDKVLPMRTGTPVSITVEAGPTVTGNDTITCEIQLDGQPWKREIAAGSAAVVTCNGVVGQ